MREARWLRRLLPVGLIVAAFAAAPSAASAASCTPTLGDAEGWSWDLNPDGTISDGTGDAFDTYGAFAVDGNAYPSAGADACGREDADREVTYPDAPVGATGLVFSRKVYVPTDDDFARFLDLVSNPTASDITVAVTFAGNLGSDSSTEIRGTEDGDATHEPEDAWIVSDESLNDDPSDPTVSHVFDSTLAGVDTVDNLTDTFANGDDTGTVQYTNVTVPAGGTVAFMHAAAQNGSFATQAALDDAARLARGPVTLYSGLSDGERAALQNFPADGDVDADGVSNGADNCVENANSDQADLDGDGAGDACDDDIDGDGAPNGVEAVLGTDPRNADSDGDTVADGSDACPKNAGPAANGGCPGDDRPPTVELTSPADGAKLKTTEAHTLTATASDDAGVAQVMFVDDATVVCTDTTAPYTCDYKPGAADVGRNTLVAVAVDTAGQSAFDAAAVRLNRFKPTRVTARTSPKSDTTDPRTFVTRGEVELPEPLTASACRAGTVRVTFKAGKKTISSKNVKVSKTCRFRSRKTFSLPERLTDDKLRVAVRFNGNAVLRAKKARIRKVTVR